MNTNTNAVDFDSIMAAVNKALAVWADGEVKAEAGREAAKAATEGASLALLNAGGLWVAAHGTGKDSAKDFRAMIAETTVQVWAKAPARYRKILTVKDDGTPVLRQTALNAISVMRGGIEFGLITEGMTFGALRKAVTEARKAANAAELAPGVAEARQTIAEALAAIKAATGKLDDLADLAAIAERLAELQTEAEATIAANAEAETAIKAERARAA